ncbi:MAG: aminotransferase class I/II-fold pyridoxal phosphate-dependent enzyme [Acidobacteriota bacterium]
MVPRADYLVWAKRRPHPANDLARSDVVALALDDLPGARAALELSGRNDDGYPPLVEAIAARYRMGVDCVATATGASGANFLACVALVGPGDDVLVEQPGYDPLCAAPRMLGANLVRFERRFEDGFRLDPDRVAAALTPRTRLIIITNLHNPTCAAIGESEMRALGAIADRHGLYVLVDEIYLDSALDQPCPPAATIAPCFISTSSLTKVYGLAAFRCGWALASPRVAEQMRRARDLVDGSGSVLIDRASVVAFEHLPALAERSRSILGPNLALVESFMAAQTWLEWVKPAGGTVAFPRLRSGQSADALAERLLREYDTAVVPGRFFDAPSHFRMAFGIRRDALERGLAALADALAGA